MHMLEEAKKRDHRKIGKEMELFTFSKKVGQGKTNHAWWRIFTNNE